MSSSSELNFSSASILEEPFETHKPHLAFDGATVDEWRTWRERLLPELWERFGRFPDKTAPLKPKIVSTQAFDKFTHHKVIYSSREDVPIPAHLLIPHGITGKTPPSSASTVTGGAAKRMSRSVPGNTAPRMDGRLRNAASSRYARITPEWASGRTPAEAAIFCGAVSIYSATTSRDIESMI